MRFCWVTLLDAFLAIWGGISLSLATAQGAGPELWFYASPNLALSQNVTDLEALIARAAAAGYSHLMLNDVKLGWDGNVYQPPQYAGNLRQVINYAAARGIHVVPASYDLNRGEDYVLPLIDQNLEEGQQVIGANYQVSADGTSLTFQPQAITTTNLGFESGTTGWSLDAGRAIIDTKASDAHSGSRSLEVVAGGGRGFAVQTINVQPNRQYHVTFWAKTQGFSGDLLAKVLDPSAGVYREFNEGSSALAYSATQGWKQYDYVFNSAGSTQLQLRLGSWGPTTGTMWFDDVQVQEIGLENVVANSTSPVKVYRANGTPLTIGKDVNPIQEPYSQNGMTFALYGTPLTPTIPASGSSLKPGDLVKINYDAAQPFYDGQYAVDCAGSTIQAYYSNVTKQLLKSFAPGTGFMLGGYDEIRQGNTSTGDKALGLTAGQLLAQSFQSTYNTIRAQDPTAPIYTWSDMFDRNHNATNNYYLWNGNLAGSWNGLPKDVTIFNWNLSNLNTSLKFFSGLGNQQLIAGYYDDVGNGYADAVSEVQAAQGVAGVRGLMYTTWTGSDGYVSDGNYGDLESYAAGAKAAWPASEPGTRWAASAISGNWSNSRNWTDGVPNSAGAGAVFNQTSGGTNTVTIDGPQTVGTIVLGGSASPTSYLLTGSTLTMNNNGSGATVTVANGAHKIDNTTLVLADSAGLTVSGSGTMAFGSSSRITDNGQRYKLTLNAHGGKLILSGSDNYSGGTNVETGTLVLASSTAVLDGTSLTVGAGGTMIFDPSAGGAPVVSSATSAAVPEPDTLVLLVTGAVLADLARRRRLNNRWRIAATAPMIGVESRS